MSLVEIIFTGIFGLFMLGGGLSIIGVGRGYSYDDDRGVGCWMLGLFFGIIGALLLFGAIYYLAV